MVESAAAQLFVSGSYRDDVGDTMMRDLANRDRRSTAMKLSEPQKRTLLHAIKGGTRIFYSTSRDPCMTALASKGLASFNSNIGEKYGRPNWWITDAGMVEAKKLAAPCKS